MEEAEGVCACAHVCVCVASEQGQEVKITA